uniref:Uncharacterized protein n=1 Tax=Picea glauca TaxID=3330 RepID=A0A117NJE0_PICGL|nr:hypothetical protein ABT39_MTgene1242 [Picea glauca]
MAPHPRSCWWASLHFFLSPIYPRSLISLRGLGPGLRRKHHEIKKEKTSCAMGH